MQKLINTLFICTMIAFASYAQPNGAPYYFSVDSSSYDTLSNATVVSSQGWDDPEITFALPFGFEFMGDTLTSLALNDFFLGGILTDDVSDTGIHPLLVAYGSDIIDRSSASTVSEVSTIAYETTGTAGDQIFKIEWKKVGFYNEVDNEDTSSQYLSFQLWLYEGSNDIEIHWGPNVIDLDPIVHDVGNGAFIGFAEGYDMNADTLTNNIWYLQGDPSNPDFVSDSTFSALAATTTLSDDPVEGLIYRFSTSEPISSVERVETAIENTFKVYPTIAKDYLVIEAEAIAAPAQIQVVNQLGQTIKLLQVTNMPYTMNTTSWAKGAYFIQIEQNGMKETHRIIKQ